MKRTYKSLAVSMVAALILPGISAAAEQDTRPVAAAAARACSSHRKNWLSSARQYRLTYTVTVDDPVTQTASWTARMPWKRDDTYQFFEYACHEDNEAIRNYIVTSRARRAAEASRP